jgi:hypothetical protein
MMHRISAILRCRGAMFSLSAVAHLVCANVLIHLRARLLLHPVARRAGPGSPRLHQACAAGCYSGNPEARAGSASETALSRLGIRGSCSPPPLLPPILRRDAVGRPGGRRRGLRLIAKPSRHHKFCRRRPRRCRHGPTTPCDTRLEFLTPQHRQAHRRRYREVGQGGQVFRRQAGLIRGSERPDETTVMRFRHGACGKPAIAAPASFNWLGDSRPAHIRRRVSRSADAAPADVR